MLTLPIDSHSVAATLDAVVKTRHLKRYETVRRLTAVMILLWMASSTVTQAAPGDLDTTFGNTGIIYTQFAQFNEPLSVALQTDGKIVTAGYSRVGATHDFAFVRYNSNGSLDTSFNGTGRVNTPIGAGNDVAFAVAIQPDGKLVAAGYSDGGTSINFALVRLNMDGSLDTSFNGTGKVITVFGPQNSAYPYAIAIQPDGKIVAAGLRSNGTGTNLALLRYNSNGSLDVSFNGTGEVFTTGTYSANALALQSNGKIVVAGRSASNHFTVLRYNTDGSLDMSFNGTGMAITTFNTQGDEARAIAIQPDGKIVAAGKSGPTAGFGDFATARYNPDGSLDLTFNGTGKVITQIGGGLEEANAVALQPNGKIVAAGMSNNAQSNTCFALVRYNVNGSLDTSFNGTGTVTTSGTYKVYAVAIQPEGKIVAVGINALTFQPVSVVVRYLGDLKTNRVANFDTDSRSDISIWNPTDHNWYVLNSISNTLVVREGWGNGSLGDRIVPGDYDGDGRADFAVYRPSEGSWYISLSADGSTLFRHWGDPADTPVPGDYDLDGKTDVAVFRPSESNWYILSSRENTATVISWGATGDKPAPGDYDGDGATDVAVYRPSDGNWYIIGSHDRFTRVVHCGIGTDKLVPADYDGDGRIDVAVFRPSDGTWYIRPWTGVVIVKNWGVSTDLPVPADYDGDGIADIAVYRPSEMNWYINQSTSNTIRVATLQHDGVPVPYGYVPN